MEASHLPHTSASAARPRSITILAWLLLLQGSYVLGYGLFLFFRFPAGLDAGKIFENLPFAITRNFNNPSLIISLGVAGMITAIAIWNLQSWSWMAAVILQGFSLASALVAYMQRHPNYIAMAVGILLVFYLNYHEIQEALVRKRGQ